MSNECPKCKKPYSFTERFMKPDMCSVCYKAEKEKDAQAIEANKNATSFEVAGKQLICNHCDGENFIRGTAQLNTAVMSFIGLDWMNQSADTFLCKDCGKVEWFVLDGNKKVKPIKK